MADRMNPTPESDESSPAVLAFIFSKETLLGSHCFDCDLNAALFTVGSNFLGDCPGCIARRVRSLLNDSGWDYAWLVALLTDADREVQLQLDRENTKSALRFDDFYRCHRCDKVVHANDARYHLAAGGTAFPPYCVECNEYLERGAPGPDGPERVLFQVVRDAKTGWLHAKKERR